MEQEIKIFEDPQKLAEEFCGEFSTVINKYTGEGKKINIALSGGNTPVLFFEILAEKYGEKILWDSVNFFWADERCVPPGSAESNYGMAKKFLLDKIDISGSNIHRIRGEEYPFSEAGRYSKEVAALVPMERSLPQFDIILLGLGADGHTASIFPGHIEPQPLNELYTVTIQPLTEQKRITITELVINNAVWVYFLVSGSDKAATVSKIVNRYPEAGGMPAFHVQPLLGKLTWFLDKEAAAKI